MFGNGTDADVVLTVSEHGFEGHLYDAGGRDKVVITFSGSDGGSIISDTMAWYYKQNGISALGVTLFAGKETVKSLDHVPLEYAKNALEWLKAQGYKRSAVDGLSKGSEYALLAASFYDDISCVIVRVPSYFVSEGIVKRNPSGTSCWSYQGKGFDYVPYKIREFHMLKQFFTHHEMNILEFNTNKSVTAESIIPVERIKGPILLLSSEVDTVWPSAEQADYIVDYLQKHGFPYEVKHIKYNYLSHMAVPLRRSYLVFKLLFRSERDHPKECAQQRNDLSEQIIDFIQNHW